MGLLKSIREVLGIGSRGPGEAPARRPPDVTYRAELVSAQHEGYESVYLSTERQAELLAPRADGLPPLHLVRHAGALWLAEDTTGKLINVDNRYLRRLGIFGVKVRGTPYYTGRARLGPAALVREPDNPHDPNAVAIHVGGEMLGHYNKGMARSLAKRLDAGEPLQAVVISTDPAKVISAPSDILRHLYRTF
ncbi:HIRAN domain-containing protein [Microbacterium algeriense]|uniref:HIRAN domain-containing protein n=1 Tax=Microbacterium algeriense TaxID=2615184 RepID=UPI0022E4C6FE|nr:HIRAN domain-containing protein [Microbacterium algeriense]